MWRVIHNNPRTKEMRMPVILPTELQDDRLKPIVEDLDKEVLKELLQPYDAAEREAFTVRPLKGCMGLVIPQRQPSDTSILN